MAEGYSFNPNESEHEEVTAPDTKGVFNRFLRSLKNGERFAHSPESDDDDDEKKKKRFGRLRRLFGSVFGLTVDHEPVEGGSTPEARPSMFGIVTEFTGNTPSEGTAETEVNTEQPNRVEAESPVSAESVPTEPAESPENSDLVTYELEPESLPTEPENTSEVHIDAQAQAGSVEQQERATTAAEISEPERVGALLPRLPRRHTVYEYEKPRDVFEYHPNDKKVEALERKVKELEKEAAKKPDAAPAKSPEVKAPHRVEAALPPKIIEAAAIKKVERITTAPERIPQYRVENETENRAETHAERSAVAPEKLINAEDEEAKEIAYEMSHEHKDLDKQSALAWAALQDTAAKTAQGNAAALASAQNDVASAKLAANDPHSAAKVSRDDDHNSLYKRAVIMGATTAVVVIAAIIVILLLQSK